MKLLIPILFTLISMCAQNPLYAAIVTNDPKLSPSLGEYDNATVTDENGNVLPAIGLVPLDSSGHSTILSADLVPGIVSPVTNRMSPPLYKLSGGKKIPVMGLVGVNTSTKALQVFAPGGAGAYVLKAGDTMSGILAMGTNKITGMGDPSAAQDAATKAYVDKTAVVECSAYAGGAASAALTCTGLAGTDTVLSVFQRVAGANGTAINGYSGLGSNALTVSWTADPGAGAIVRVLVKH